MTGSATVSRLANVALSSDPEFQCKIRQGNWRLAYNEYDVARITIECDITPEQAELALTLFDPRTAKEQT